MPIWRLAMGVGASVLVHWVSVVALDGVPEGQRTKPRAAALELTPLPPPPLPPQPPAPPKLEQEPRAPEPTTPEHSKPSRKTQPPAADAVRSPTPDVSPVAEHSQPVVLAGLTLSNAGVAVSVGSAPSVKAGPTTAPRPAVASAPKATSPLELTPAKDLARKPIPPSLDAALAQHYPATLRNQGIEGEALIRVVLKEDGRVSEMSALSESHTGFAAACRRAVGSSRWEPPINKQGNPTKTAVKYRCRFKVNL